jgi:hypothetical protein
MSHANGGGRQEEGEVLDEGNVREPSEDYCKCIRNALASRCIRYPKYLRYLRYLQNCRYLQSIAGISAMIQDIRDILHISDDAENRKITTLISPRQAMFALASGSIKFVAHVLINLLLSWRGGKRRSRMFPEPSH